MPMRNVKLGVRRFNSRGCDELARPALRLACILEIMLTICTAASFSAAMRLSIVATAGDYVRLYLHMFAATNEGLDPEIIGTPTR